MKRKRRYDYNGSSFLLELLIEMLAYVPRLLFRLLRWIND